MLNSPPLIRVPSPWVVGLMLCATLVAVPADAVERQLDQKIFAGEVHTLEIDLGIGNITVEGTDGRDVEIEVDLNCGRENASKCSQRAQRIKLNPRRKKGLLKVRLKGTPRGRAGGISAEMRLKVPRRLGLELDLQSGNVRISGMDSHMEIDVAAGDVDLVVQRATTQKINLSTAVGRAELWLDEGRIDGTGFPRSLNWNGSGTAELEVDIASGNISVRLD